MRNFCLALSAAFLLTSCEKPPREMTERTYTEAEIQRDFCAEPKQCVDYKDSVWFINAGFVFRNDKMTHKTQYQNGWAVKEIVDYKGLVVGLDKSGDIYLATTNQRGSPDWVKIGKNAKSLWSDDRNLIAVMNDDSIWAYQGKPGPVRFNYMMIPRTMTVGSSTITTFTMMPQIDGREMAFKKTKINEVRNIRQHSSTGELFVETGTHAESPLQTLLNPDP